MLFVEFGSLCLLFFSDFSLPFVKKTASSVFGRVGHQVAICARGEKELEVVRQLAPDRCHAIVADLSTEKGVKDRNFDENL